MLQKEQTILREILWGERPIHHLPFVKIRLLQTATGYRVENPRHLAVTAQPQDVARGLLRYRLEISRLQVWARFILETPEIYSLELQGSEAGETLFQALNSVAQGGPLSPEALQTAQTLVPEFPKKRFLGEPHPPPVPKKSP
ncbi:MAG: hypothetical protein ACE5ER_00505 [Nitrospinaceae bacterium]